VTTPIVHVSNGQDSKKKPSNFEEDDWDDELPTDRLKNLEVNTNNAFKPTVYTGPSISPEVMAFKGYFLVVEEEDYLLEEETEKAKKKLVPKNVKMDSTPSSGTEVYEKFLIPGTDEVSNKFISRISKFPAQIVRYNLNGTPLLNQTTRIEPGKCVCGLFRRFELQFTPGLITSLEGLDKKRQEMDFGTVLMYTCPADCNERGINWEEAVVLEDPDSEAIQSAVNIGT